SSEEAEPLLDEGAFHLALLDIYLGNKNGLEFLEKLKSLQPACNCVMMTAHASMETVARSVAKGALEYLSKPLLIDDLLAVVRRMETRRQQPSQTAKESLHSDQLRILPRNDSRERTFWPRKRCVHRSGQQSRRTV